MAETYGPFDGAPWAQAQWFDFAPTWAPSGVIGTPAASTTTGELALAVNGLNLTLGTGRAWVRGAGYRNDAGKAFTVSANANATLARRDRIVLRRDLAAKTVTAIQLAGTPAGSPQAPALQQSDAGQFDLPLFSFLVPANSGTTLSGFLDERPWLNPNAPGAPRIFPPMSYTWGGSGLPVAATGSEETGFNTVGALPAFYVATPTRLMLHAQFRAASSNGGAATCSVRMDGVTIGVPGTVRTDHTISVHATVDVAAGFHTPSLRVDGGGQPASWVSFSHNMHEGAAG